MNDLTLKLFQDIILACFIPLLTILSNYFIKFIQVKIDELKKTSEKLENENQQALTQKYLEMLKNTVQECVITTNQTFVDNLKSKGEFNNSEVWAEAFDKSRNAVMAILTDEAQEYLSQAVGDLDIYIKNLIEVAVVNNKK